MRLNKYVAAATGMSRRKADTVIAAGRVQINGAEPNGQGVLANDTVTLDGKPLAAPATTSTIMLNKPIDYVCSRNGQGSKTVYDLLPSEYHHLKPVGRLDKESSGLLLLTNDGKLAHELTHPSFAKQKRYEVTLDAALQPLHRQMISDHGIQLEDGPSKLLLARIHEGNDRSWEVTMSEGRNRQIRRTFAALGYRVTRLHRTQFGNHHLGTLQFGDFKELL